MNLSGAENPPTPATMVAERRIAVMVSGTIDATTAVDLERLVCDALTAQPDMLVLELAAVSDCDSAAVLALLRIHAVCEQQRVGLRVMPSAAVRSVVAADRAARTLPLDG